MSCKFLRAVQTNDSWGSSKLLHMPLKTFHEFQKVGKVN